MLSHGMHSNLGLSRYAGASLALGWNERCLSIGYSMVILGSCLGVISKFSNFLRFLAILGEKITFSNFSIFLGNQEKSVRNKNCTEFHCGHF